MSSDNKPNISFGTVMGDAVIGDQHKGDIVHGNKDASQGKTEITGDMHGDISHTFNLACAPTDVIDVIEREFNKHFEPDSDFEFNDKDTVVDADTEPVVPSEDDEYTTAVVYEAPDVVFDDMRKVAAKESPDQAEVAGVMTRFTRIVTAHGPKLGRAMFAGVVAGLKATIDTHPLTAAAIGFLETFQDD